jgi:hypothetical protein
MKSIHVRVLRQFPGCTRRHWAAQFAVAAVVWSLPWLLAVGTEPPVSTQFRQEVQPILKEYCYDCHGDGESKGKVAFDELKSNDALMDHDLWLKVMKNVRAGIMPPQKKPRPSDVE